MSKEFDYERLYNWMAPFYAPAMRLLPIWRRYTEEALPWLPPTGAILEIGPGPGVLLKKIARRYPQTFGFDLAPGMLRLAQKRLHDAQLVARLTQGDALHLPFVQNSFEAIVMTFVFSAFPDGPGAMRELARILCPNGLLVLVDGGVPSDGNRIGRGLAHTWELFGDYMRDEAALMREAGLTIVRRKEFGAFNSVRLVVGKKSISYGKFLIS